MGKTTCAKKTQTLSERVDHLAELGGWRDSPGHADLLAEAKKTLPKMHAALDEWFAALKNPLATGSVVKADEAREWLEDRCGDLIGPGADLVLWLETGLAVESHSGAAAPQCPANDGQCGAPVAKGHTLCYPCERAQREAGVAA